MRFGLRGSVKWFVILVCALILVPIGRYAYVRTVTPPGIATPLVIPVAEHAPGTVTFVQGFG